MIISVDRDIYLQFIIFTFHTDAHVLIIDVRKLIKGRVCLKIKIKPVP